MGRPTKCTPEVIAEYCRCIVEDEVTLAAAAALAGIDSYATIQNWRRLGAEGKSPYRAFLAAEEKALAEWQRDRLREMKAAGSNWVRPAWQLERRMPDEYGRRERVEHVGDGGGPVRIQHGTAEVIADPGLRALAAELVGRASSGPPEPGESGDTPEPRDLADGAAPEAAQ
jgi:hypothetical protein